MNLSFLTFFGQIKSSNDTLSNNISVMFNKVKYSNEDSCRAELNAKYLPDTNRVLITFEVPNYDLRFKTTLNDYAIVKFEGEELKMQNLVETVKNERGHHIFVFELTKVEWVMFSVQKLKLITFYFLPNEAFIVKSLQNHKGFGSDLELMKPYVKLASQTVKTTISKPNKIQYKELIAWLQKF